MPCTRKRTATDMVDGQSSATSKFADIMEGSVMRTVIPNTCIPLIEARRGTKSGVDRLKRIFRGILSNGEMLGEINVTAGSDAAIVIPLQGALRQHIRGHFRLQGIPEEEISCTIEKYQKWYGIVDGNYRHKAIIQLMKEEPSTWESFKWSVCIIKSGCSLDRLRQLARCQNAKHDDDAWIETTLYDTLKGLYDEFLRLQRRPQKAKTTAVEVAAAYDGMIHSSRSTIYQTATTAIRLSGEFIRELGNVMNEEHVDLASQLLPEGHIARQDATLATRYVDCRVFRKVVTLTSLKQATCFMNATGIDGPLIQINVLYRLRTWSKSNNYKSASFRVVTDQFRLASAAMKEARKFETLLGSTTWPIEMHVLKRNLLRGFQLDNEVEANSGNDIDIIPSVLDMFRELRPQTFPQLFRKFKNSFHSPPENSTEDQATPPSTLSDPVCDGTGNIQNDGEAGMTAVPTPSTAASEHLQTVESAKTDDVLVKAGIHLLQMSWQKYSKTVRNEKSDMFDLVLTDPSYGGKNNEYTNDIRGSAAMEQGEFTEFSQFCRASLRKGGYVFIFSAPQYLHTWTESLSAVGLEVMPYPYVLSKCMNGRQFRRKGKFPENFVEFGVVAQQPGVHERGFSIDLESPYHNLVSKMNRRLALLDKVPIVRHKLTFDSCRKPVRPEEKSVLVLIELMTTFCPESGTVFDGYGGTFTTAIAALQSGRKCVSTESDRECFRLAYARALVMHAAIFVTENRRSRIQHDVMRRSGTDEDNTVPNSIANSIAPASMTTGASVNDKFRSDDDRIMKSPTNKGPSVFDNFMSREDIMMTTPDPQCQSRDMETELQFSQPERHVACSADPRDALLHVISSGKNDGTVNLHILGEQVGTATLHTIPNGENQILRPTLHGLDISAEQGGILFVVVWKVNIFCNMRGNPYPYPSPGLGDSPRTLSDLSEGFYLWDARECKPKINT